MKKRLSSLAYGLGVMALIGIVVFINYLLSGVTISLSPAGGTSLQDATPISPYEVIKVTSLVQKGELWQSYSYSWDDGDAQHFPSGWFFQTKAQITAPGTKGIHILTLKRPWSFFTYTYYYLVT